MDPRSDTRQYPRAFPAIIAITAVAFLSACVVFNLQAEHVSGESVTDSFVEPAGIAGSTSERKQKMMLLSKTDDPAFVFIGNSRVQRWNPEVVFRATGERGFNASIVGSSLTDARAIVEWLASRARKHGSNMPHVIISTPPEIFGEQPPTPNDLGLPQFSGSSTRWERLQSRLQRLARLTQWQSTQQAYRIFAPRNIDRSTMSRRHDSLSIQDIATAPSPPLEEAQTTRPNPRASIMPSHTKTGDAFTADRNMSFQSNGYLRAGAFFGSSSFGGKHSLERLVVGQYRQFYDSVKRRGGSERIEPSARRELERTLRIANHAGDIPTLVMPPMRSDLIRELDALGRPAYRSSIDSWLDKLHDRYSFTVIDIDNTKKLPVTANMFYDGVHPHKNLADAIVYSIIEHDPRFERRR